MSRRNLLKINLFGFVILGLLLEAQAGVLKDLYNKVTHSNSNKTEDLVKQSAPICGSSVFSSSDKSSLSPEIIFITNRASRSELVDENSHGREHEHHSGAHSREHDNGRESERREQSRREDLNEVAREYRFNVENVTLQDLERHGFNPEAPVSFLMHGFTSGYPLQAWISAIVEAYTIDRESTGSYGNSDQTSDLYHQHSDTSRRKSESSDEISRRRNNQDHRQPSSGNRVRHNLFIVNWNYAARGIVYPRAVANIPIVASYVTRFINEKLLDEAHVDPRRVQLIGHSLGAHLAGFIGKNTRSKLGRIYGLDPAGPCFGSISGPLYPSSNRLAPSDAEQVVTIHTNTALLGIDKPLGRYSVFVEGGEVQPGCKGGGVFKSISTLTWDGGDFYTIACSHSRAPNLLTYRHDQSDSEDNCQMIAYECKDWESFLAGHCGNCVPSDDPSLNDQSEPGSHSTASGRGHRHPLQPVECLRIGLDWQYPKKQTTVSSDVHNHRETEWQRPTTNGYSTSHSQYESGEQESGGRENYPSRRPNNQPSTSSYYESRDDDKQEYNNRTSSTRRPHHSSGSHSSSHQRNRRATSNSTEVKERRNDDDTVKSKLMFLRTGDTQPYCAYHYQVILELNEPFEKKPPMSLLLQDSEIDNRRRQPSSSSSSSERRGQNSLSSDEFGNRFDDRTYTHLLTSNKKLNRIDHATLLFPDGLPNGYKILKTLQINFMSHFDSKVRLRLSSQLCLVKTDTDAGRGRQIQEGNRFYFEPCSKGFTSNSSSGQNGRSTSRPAHNHATAGPFY